jgi:hypothetical protein
MPLPAPFDDSPANREALARARGAIAEHRAGFEAFEAGALRSQDPLEAAALARMAFTYGMLNHPGRLASASLERLLHELGRAHVPGDSAAAAGSAPRPRHADAAGQAAEAGAAGAGACAAGAPRRVLHVATVVYETGGHGRVLERWLERDAARTPTMLLLKDDEPVPASLTCAVQAAGGAFAPSLPPGDLFARARALRALAAAHDLVVLHVSNHEVVVPLAFADPAGRPPTIFFNHSSHLMWVGVGCSDAVASFNAFDADWCVRRRGVAPDAATLLPLPVASTELPARADARRELGLDPDAPVVLTISSPYKLRPVLTPAYRDLAAAVLDAVPDATLLAVGPAPGDPSLPEHERVRAFGTLTDLRLQLAAADLLLDSWPLSGGTTVIDAAIAGLPVLSLGDPPVPLIGPRGDQLGEGLVCARDVPALAARAAELLLRDRDACRARGQTARETVLARNDAGWVDALEATVATACARAGAARPPARIEPDEPTDGECAIQLVRDGHDQPCSLRDAYRWIAPELPPERVPRTYEALMERVEQLRAGAPAPRRALAAPAIEAGAIAAVLGEARRLATAGEIASCTLVVPPDRLDDAVALIEAELAENGEQLDVELIAGEGVESIVTAADVLLPAARS